ncbi:MAG: serine/threonine-protein phosphatase [Deltaproteobacteria bacterium]|nr:serine/threonine-protein phosphatase [Deltaproteobacteria bacterium]
MMIHGVSHRGFKRDSNEDRYLCRKLNDGSLLMAVADGMGGQAGGEVAAQIAIDVIAEFDPALEPVEEQLESLIREADYRIRRRAEENTALEGMGTTLTIALVKAGVAYWAHLGDSRLYLFRGRRLAAVTGDHTIPGFLLAEGKISREDARVHPMRSGLLDCVGCGSLDKDSGAFNISEGDLLVLTTDGLHDYVSEDTIRSILDSGKSLEDRFRELVNAALDAGGYDNITVAGAQF